MNKNIFKDFSFSPLRILMRLAVFFVVLYPYTVSIDNYIYLSTAVKYLTLLFAAFVFFSTYCLGYKRIGKLKSSIKLNGTEAIMAVIVFYITVNNYEIKHGSFYYVITFWSIWLMMVIGKSLNSWQDELYILVQIFTMFYAVMTITTFVSPTFYFKFVLPLFDIESQKQLIKAYQNGFMAGFTDHYSTNGMYLSIGLGVFASKLLNNFKSFKNIVCTIIMLGALLLTGKRGPLLFSVIAIVFVYYFFKADKPKGRILKIISLILVGAVALLIASIWIPQLLNVVNRFFSESDSGDVTAGRGPLYALAYSLFLEKPIFGHGWGSYPSYYYENLGKYMTVYKYRHAHNIYLQLLCEVGIIGFVLYVAFFLYNLFNTIILFKEYRKDEKYFPQSAENIMPFCLFVQLFFILYGMTGNPLYDVAMLFPYYFSIMYIDYYKENMISISNLNRLFKTLRKKELL